MSEREMQELFRRLKDIYRLRPEVAQELLRRILEILHDANGDRGVPDGT